MRIPSTPVKQQPPAGGYKPFPPLSELVKPGELYAYTREVPKERQMSGDGLGETTISKVQMS